MRQSLAAGITGLVLAGLTAVVMGYAPVISVPGPTSSAPARDTGLNVVMLIWDGVRIDELMGHADQRQAPDETAPLLPYFWGELAPKGRIYGDRREGHFMAVANPALVSLPAYESIFAGSTQPCQSNDCGRVRRSTFPERLVRDLALPRRQVATFASWDGMTLAVESAERQTYVNAGAEPVRLRGDAEEAELNARQSEDLPPWSDARFDRYTWRQAMRYLEAERPRVLYVSLVDTDEWAHKRRYHDYVEAIRQNDVWLRELVDRLAGMGEYGRNTCLIVTTDHGRGSGRYWPTHSNGAPYSALVLMYAGCPLAPERVAFKEPSRLTTHLDIRPTVEQLFGLQPYSCVLCGSSLVEDIQRPHRVADR